MAARNREDVLSAIASQKQGETQLPWLVATQDESNDPVRIKPLLETTSRPPKGSIGSFYFTDGGSSRTGPCKPGHNLVFVHRAAF